MYLLGLGSPTFPLPPESYAAYCSTYQWKEIYDREVLYSGPLFTHQLSHLWIDFRGIRDAFMREHGSDYFENSRQATYIHQEYASQQPARVRRLRRVLLGHHGDRRARLGRGDGGTVSSGSSTATMPAERPTALTTERWRRGWWSPRCRSLRRS